MLRYRSSLHRCRNCKKGKIIWMIQENLKIQNRIAMEKYFTFPVNQQSFQVLDLCWAATKVCNLTHGICLGHRETFLAIHVQCSIQHRYLSRNSSLYESKCHRWNPSAEEYRETCRERCRTNWKHNSNADFCMEAFNHEFFLSSGNLHRILWLVSKDCKSRSFMLLNSPHFQRFHVGRWDSKHQESSCSSFPSEAILWINEAEMVDSVDDSNHRDQLRVLISRTVKCWTRGLLLLWTRSSRIPTSRKRSVWRKWKLREKTVSFRGRQIAYMIYESFRVTGANDSVENFADLFTISLRNGDVQEFDSKWDGIFMIKD